MDGRRGVFLDDLGGEHLSLYIDEFKRVWLILLLLGSVNG
jgi:hypothetical protein